MSTCEVNVIDQAYEIVRRHRPMEIEPSDTICGECSYRLPNGRYMGKVVEWPCDAYSAARAVKNVVDYAYDIKEHANHEGMAGEWAYAQSLDEEASAILNALEGKHDPNAPSTDT